MKNTNDVEVKVVWEKDGVFYTARMSGEGIFETKDKYEEFPWHDEDIWREYDHLFTLKINPPYTIQKTDFDPRVREMSYTVDNPTVDDISKIAESNDIPPRAAVEIHPGYVSFRWSEV